MTYAYSPTTGLLTSLNADIHGSSIPVTYTYQGANQLRSKTVGGVMVRAYNFRYNNDGSKSALPDYINYRDPAGELMCGDNCFYDESGRLIEIRDSATVNRTDVTPVTIATYGYDRQGQLTTATVGGTSYTYTYDTAGNIQSKQIGGTTTNYTYGNGAWRDLLTAYDGHEISYDGCGNPTRYYDGSAFTWTQGRRLATATVGNTNISYTYDMAGVRSSKTVNGTEYRYTTLSGLVTRQEWNGSSIDFIYDESGQPLAMKYNGTLYYYILNAQGDVVRIIDGSRNVVASYSYDPWGNIISSSGALAEVNPLRYRGYYYDSETGFYYLQSRYYDPELGRFINADSIGYLGVGSNLTGYNLFAYCGNNPVTGYDPAGTLDWGNLFKGSGWLAVGVTAIAVGVSVLTCGVAAPAIMAVAAVTVAAGAATAVNGVSELGEAATGHNFMRDDVFRGNAKANNTYAHTTAAVAEIGTMVCGGWLKANAPRIEAYNNVQNYTYADGAAKHVGERSYYDSTLLKKEIIKYGTMTNEGGGVYTFRAAGTAFSNVQQTFQSGIWELTTINGKGLIGHFLLRS